MCLLLCSFSRESKNNFLLHYGNFILYIKFIKFLASLFDTTNFKRNVILVSGIPPWSEVDLEVCREGGCKYSPTIEIVSLCY